MLVQTHKTGIKYAARSYGNAVGYCALSIKVGTRDEAGFHSGIAHFLEHTLFKGTSAKSSTVINGYLEKLGGELNAYTTREEIVLHATVLKEDMAKAVSLLLEIASDAQFPHEEIETEKHVVIDEIASYKDTPADDIYDVFEEKIFSGTNMSTPILGTPESVMAMSSEELQAFRTRFFTPSRMALTMVSPLSERQMEEIACRCIEKSKLGGAVEIEAVPAGTTTCDGVSSALGHVNSAADLVNAPFELTVDKENNQVNCVLGGLAPKFAMEEQRLATILLCNLLGGPALNSILGTQLREKHGWVYNVDCGYTAYTDTGIATIQFGCDHHNIRKCLRCIRRELDKLIEAPLSEARLKAAKRQLLGQNAIGMESGEAQCISMGKSLMAFGGIYSDSEIVAKVQAITAEQVREAARSIFSKESVSTLIYL